MKTRANAGFSLLELLISMAIFVMLIGLITINLSTTQRQTNLSTIVETLVTDLNHQQIKAMVGDTEGRSTFDTYGIQFAPSGYTLFYGTYSPTEPTNFGISFPTGFQLTTTFPDSQIIFLKGSGEVANYNASQNTITIQNTGDNTQKVIRINRYGVITSVD